MIVASTKSHRTPDVVCFQTIVRLAGNETSLPVRSHCIGGVPRSVLHRIATEVRSRKMRLPDLGNVLVELVVDSLGVKAHGYWVTRGETHRRMSIWCLRQQKERSRSSDLFCGAGWRVAQDTAPPACRGRFGSLQHKVCRPP